MIRSLIVAMLTFVLLGSYYSHARSAVEGTTMEGESRRVARSAALVGANLAKKELADRWTDHRCNGVHGGGTYRAMAIVRRDRGAINSLGLVESKGLRVADYSVRVDIRRHLRSPNDPGAGYVFTIAPPAKPS